MAERRPMRRRRCGRIRWPGRQGPLRDEPPGHESPSVETPHALPRVPCSPSSKANAVRADGLQPRRVIIARGVRSLPFAARVSARSRRAAAIAVVRRCVRNLSILAHHVQRRRRSAASGASQNRTPRVHQVIGCACVSACVHPRKGLACLPAHMYGRQPPLSCGALQMHTSSHAEPCGALAPLVSVPAAGPLHATSMVGRWARQGGRGGEGGLRAEWHASQWLRPAGQCVRGVFGHWR